MWQRAAAQQPALQRRKTELSLCELFPVACVLLAAKQMVLPRDFISRFLAADSLADATGYLFNTRMANEDPVAFLFKSLKCPN